jgi:two-component system CheB/CheR fusion protein
MQHRNDLLSQLNNDLTNLLNSINLAMVMVGADLSVRRFTPQATTMLGLMASDLGRPIPRLKLKIDAARLEGMMLEVIHEVQPRQAQVQDQEGKWLVLRITPYRTLDNRIEGVVLTILDRNAFEGLSAGKPGAPAQGLAPKKSATRRK